MKKILVAVAISVVFLAGFFVIQAVRTSSNYGQEIESAVLEAILTFNENRYLKGETQAEGHKILDLEDSGGQTKVYCIASYCEYGFENDVFTQISGCSSIPVLIIFSGKESTGYSLLSYREPLDGNHYQKSVREMFPGSIYIAFQFSGRYHKNLQLQEEVYAKQYLASIEREGYKISNGSLPKILPEMNVQASNQLIGLFGEYPYWLGTLERLENGTRYIYCKEFDQANQIVTYTKTNADGAVVEKYVIDTTDGTLIFLEGQRQMSRL